MKPITFSLKKQLEFSLDMSPLTPDKLSGLSIAKIKKLKLQYGKQFSSVDELFNVTGEDTKSLKFTKGSRNLNSIGKEMNFGVININGDAGDYTGQHMHGGEIFIKGNAGAWVGNSMSDGKIVIDGNVGDYLGAGLPGEPFGMSNGKITVKGNAGDRVGDRLRRGYIIIFGNAGDYCGSRMVAGTIMVLGKAGKYPGQGMHRGSIIMVKKPHHIPATFKSCGFLKMQFLRLLFKQLSVDDKESTFFNKFSAEAHRFVGDLSSKGKGELLILQNIKTGS